jgi:hypothetical protein
MTLALVAPPVYADGVLDAVPLGMLEPVLVPEAISVKFAHVNLVVLLL